MNDSKNGSIQALRGIAALLVVIDHTITQFNSFNIQRGYSGLILQNIQSLGVVGVYVFFMISGYIMSMTTNNKPDGFSHSVSFMKKRLVRIYPTYWVWLTAIILLWSLGVALRSHEYSINKIISSYFLIPYIDNMSDGINPVLSQGWTLIYEMLFYLIFTTLISLKVNSTHKIIITVIVFAMLNVSGLYLTLLPSSLSVFLSNGVFYFFPIGMVIFKLRHKLHSTISKHHLKFIIHASSAISILYLLLRNSDSQLIFNEASCSLLIFLSFLTSQVDNKPLMSLGDCSYSIYLSHTIIVMAYGVISKSGVFSKPTLLLMTIPVIFTSTFFGMAAYYVIEKRLQSWATRMLLPPKQSAQAG